MDPKSHDHHDQVSRLSWRASVLLGVLFTVVTTRKANGQRPDAIGAVYAEGMGAWWSRLDEKYRVVPRGGALVLMALTVPGFLFAVGPPAAHGVRAWVSVICAWVAPACWAGLGLLLLLRPTRADDVTALSGRAHTAVRTLLVTGLTSLGILLIITPSAMPWLDRSPDFPIPAQWLGALLLIFALLSVIAVARERIIEMGSASGVPRVADLPSRHGVRPTRGYGYAAEEVDQLLDGLARLAPNRSGFSTERDQALTKIKDAKFHLARGGYEPKDVDRLLDEWRDFLAGRRTAPPASI